MSYYPYILRAREAAAAVLANDHPDMARAIVMGNEDDCLAVRVAVRAIDLTIAKVDGDANDLLTACQRVAHILQHCPDKQEKAVALLLAAIAKAEGRS
jgi:hypothetical protein